MIYNQDFNNLSDIQDKPMDAVVAVSALEHNPLDCLPEILNKLLRVLKPGGVLLATLGSARDQDWFHEPSQGWCYTMATTRKMVELPADLFSNEGQFDRLLTFLTGCDELRIHLAPFYFRSGNNGMHWGVWDPQYQPVGVCRIK